MLQVKSFICNPIEENTYIVWEEASRECAIIDAGCYTPEEKAAVQDFIRQEGLSVKYLLSTHLHFDHIFGNAFVACTFGVSLSASGDDQFLLDHFADQVALFGLPPVEPTIFIGNLLSENDTLSIGGYTFTVLQVPGHSPGSLVYYAAQAGVAFTGDALFKESIGRTDLWGGDQLQLVSAIQQKLFTLPDATVVYPGHGPSTTIGHEKAHNPYV
ncbi:MAG: MBL fold metallo-hydrolase [Porphyromonadaceae bacterium]|nr:MBL fold metallo-hydrolase [Porphyromonadaceae bacterium]